MNEEFYMTNEDKTGLLDFDTSVKQASAYCQRCSVDADREQNRAGCQDELERLVEIDLPLVVSLEELQDTCQNCDYAAAYVADALREE